jgi:predicted Zn-dependent protease
MNLSSENADVIRQVAEQSPAEQLEITLFSKNYGLTRFAGNQIHQNMAEEDTYVSVRVFHKARLGSCSTNRCDKASIRKSVEKAMGIAALNDPVNDFPGFAPPAETAELKECTYSSATAETDTNARGDIVDSILSDVQQNGFEAAGAVENGVYEKAVSTSCGQHVYQQETSAKLNLVVNRPGQAGVGTGLARWLGRDISELDCLSKAGQAVEISALNTNQVALDPGEYRVILTPEAVGLLLYYL